ncbi:hypothetical protein PIB30_090483 [Stylosanthes scabra]|uniref:Uncharacterized protein n=1 Tax=Stylosanthes scabra TaxID=79078 RepID=A0ABU6XTN5_9FABA|nr:hypothetical protein [Stylosanthes scabra]
MEEEIPIVKKSQLSVKRAEELSRKQQAILDEAEKREKDRQEKLNGRAPTLVDNDSKTAESKDHTWKPSTVDYKPKASPGCLRKQDDASKRFRRHTVQSLYHNPEERHLDIVQFPPT